MRQFIGLLVIEPCVESQVPSRAQNRTALRFLGTAACVAETSRNVPHANASDDTLSAPSASDLRRLVLGGPRSSNRKTQKRRPLDQRFLLPKQ